MKTNNVILWKERFADRAASSLKVFRIRDQ